jgi:hypothetical protein
MRRDQVWLIFPPWAESAYGLIYPALPVLAAVVQAAGLRPVQLDLNADALERLVSGRVWRDRCETLSRALAALERRRALRPAELERYHLLITDRAAVGYLSRTAGNPAEQRHALPTAVQALFPQGPGRLPSRVVSALERQLLEQTFGGRREQPLFAAITVAFDSQLRPAVRMAEWIRRTCGVPVFLGGPLISLLSPSRQRRVLARGIDGVVSGEGEAAVRAICDALRSRKNVNSATVGIPNLVSLDSRGRRRTGSPSPPTLQTLPCPLYDERLLAARAVDTLAVIAGRGCYWGRCAYCDYQALYGRRETQSPDTVVAHIQTLTRRHGVRRFELICDAVEPDFADRLASALLAAAADVEWTSFIHADRRFTPDILGSMRRAGCARLTVGLESLDDTVLTRMQKGFSAEGAEEFLRRVVAAGIPVVVNMIPDLPGTTADSARRQAARLAEVVRGADGLVEHISVFPFVLTGSSPMGRDPGRFGLVLAPRRPGTDLTHRANALAFTDPVGMTAGEKVEIFALFGDLARSTREAWVRRLFRRVGAATGDEAPPEIAEGASEPAVPHTGQPRTPIQLYGTHEIAPVRFDSRGQRGWWRAVYIPLSGTCRIVPPG